MSSDKTRAMIAFAKIAVSLAAGYALYYVWVDARGSIDEWYVPYATGLVSAVMVFVLLSKFNKGAD